MVGTVIGNYKLLQMIGAGGMGTVYEAVQQPIGRRVAIKVLHPEFAHDRDVLKRFFNEARAANLINHPSIVQVSDYGPATQWICVLGDWVFGRIHPRRSCHRSRRKDFADQAQHIAWQLASALSATHTAGIVHRDLEAQQYYADSRRNYARWCTCQDPGFWCRKAWAQCRSFIA